MDMRWLIYIGEEILSTHIFVGKLGNTLAVVIDKHRTGAFCFQGYISRYVPILQVTIFFRSI